MLVSWDTELADKLRLKVEIVLPIHGFALTAILQRRRVYKPRASTLCIVRISTRD